MEQSKFDVFSLVGKCERELQLIIRDYILLLNSYTDIDGKLSDSDILNISDLSNKIFCSINCLASKRFPEENIKLLKEDNAGLRAENDRLRDKDFSLGNLWKRNAALTREINEIRSILNTLRATGICAIMNG